VNDGFIRWRGIGGTQVKSIESSGPFSNPNGKNHAPIVKNVCRGSRKGDECNAFGTVATVEEEEEE